MRGVDAVIDHRFQRGAQGIGERGQRVELPTAVADAERQRAVEYLPVDRDPVAQRCIHVAACARCFIGARKQRVAVGGLVELAEIVERDARQRARCQRLLHR